MRAPDGASLERPSVDAFGRLRALLGRATAPAGLEPIALHLGEQRLSVPTALLSCLQAGDEWSRYPPLGGSVALRDAFAGWLDRRFDLGAALESKWIAYEPTPGAKQGVAAAIALALSRRPRRPDAAVVALPDPGYPTYAAAVAAAGGRVLAFDPEEDPCSAVASALDGMPGELAALVICNPGNPTGQLLSDGQMERLAALVGSRDAVLVVDECYVDLWRTRPTRGALRLAARAQPPCRVLVLHTLSKRSAAPGLRSGFVSGDPETVARYAAYNRNCGVSIPGPVCAVSAALWQDDAHVAQVRAALDEAWSCADAALADIEGYQRPPAGFFLWLPVADGEDAALALWREAAVSTMPGAYLTASSSAVAPARRRLRIALVQPIETLRVALGRIEPLLRRHAA